MEVMSMCSFEPENPADKLPFILDSNFAEVLNGLSYSDIVRLRHVSKRFHDYAARALLRGYEKAFENIDKSIILVDNELKELQIKLERTRQPEHCREYIKIYKQSSLLRALYGLLKLIKAVVHRYIQAGVWNFISFHSGELLDVFYSALKIVCHPEHSQNTYIIDDFFSSSGRFLQHFLNKVEPTLIPLLPVPIAFGLQLVDIFEAAQFTNYTSTFQKLPHNPFYSYEVSYQLRELVEVQCPYLDHVDEYTEDSIRRACVSTVRSSNFLYPLRQYWLLLDAYSKNSIEGILNYIHGNIHYHTGPYEEKDSCDSHHLRKQWISQKNYRFTSDCSYRPGESLQKVKKLQLDAVITCGIDFGVPLDFQPIFDSEFKDHRVNCVDLHVPPAKSDSHYDFKGTLYIHHNMYKRNIFLRRRLFICYKKDEHNIISTI